MDIGWLPKKNDKIAITGLNKKIIKCYLIGKNVEFLKNKSKIRLNLPLQKILKKLFSVLQKISRLKKV